MTAEGCNISGTCNIKGPCCNSKTPNPKPQNKNYFSLLDVQLLPCVLRERAAQWVMNS